MSERVRSLASIACLTGTVLLLMWMVLPGLTRTTPMEYASRYAASPVTPVTTLSPNHPFNAGDLAALDALPGVGEVIGQRIMDMRTSLGGYVLPEQLLFVKGIGEKTYAKIMNACEKSLDTP